MLKLNDVSANGSIAREPVFTEPLLQRSNGPGSNVAFAYLQDRHFRMTEVAGQNKLVPRLTKPRMQVVIRGKSGYAAGIVGLTAKEALCAWWMQFGN
jgi:hypothetical protein